MKLHLCIMNAASGALYMLSQYTLCPDKKVTAVSPFCVTEVQTG